MNQSKKVLAVLCCVLLLVTVVAGPMTIKARADALIIGGIALAGALIALMAASGITVTAQNMPKADIQDHVLQLWEDWQTDTAEPVDSGIYEQLDLVYDGENTYYQFGDDFMAAYGDYVNWLMNEYGLASGGDEQVVYQVQSESYSLTRPDGSVYHFCDVEWGGRSNYGYYCYYVNSCSGDFLEISVGQKLYINDSYYFWLYPWSGANYYQLRLYRSSVSNPASGNYTSYYEGAITEGSPLRFGIVSNPYSADSSHYDCVIYETSSGVRSSYCYVSDCGSIKTQYARFNPTVTDNSVSLVLVPEGAIDVPGLADADGNIYVGSDVIYPGMTLDQAGDAVLTAVEAGTLSATGTQALTQEQTIAVQQTLEFSDSYTSPGMIDVFPFCIPFDIIDFLRTMSAARRAPHFEWPIVIPSLNFEYTLVIDLSEFETVATILRTMELLLFIVGLAFVTRSMIIRG